MLKQLIKDILATDEGKALVRSAVLLEEAASKEEVEVLRGRMGTLEGGQGVPLTPSSRPS